MTTAQVPKTGEIVIYKPRGQEITLDVTLEKDTVWLNAHQLAALFEVDRTGVVRHVNNIFKSGELMRKTTCAKIAQVAKDGRLRQIDYYNLDMIISVGYRVNSRRATQFRIWATNVLKQHLIKGYTVNHKRLEQQGVKRITELAQVVAMLKKASERNLLSGDEAKGLLKVITEYTDTWLLLQQYDEGRLEEPKQKGKTRYTLTYADAQSAIRALKKNLLRRKEASDLFGQERKGALKGILGSIEQTFDRTELYATLESKAAHLLYFLIKDRPFTDGNKRIGAFLFILFLMRNQELRGRAGERKFNDNALVALVLLIAESAPAQKNAMITLIMHFVRSR